MGTTYKGPDFTSPNKTKLNNVFSTVNATSSTSTGDFSGISISASDLTLYSAQVSGNGTFTSTGTYLTLTINTSTLYIPLYK